MFSWFIPFIKVFQLFIATQKSNINSKIFPKEIYLDS